MKESIALEKICPLMSSRDQANDFTMCHTDDCMMWVTTFRPKRADVCRDPDLELEGYCALRNTMYSIDR